MKESINKLWQDKGCNLEIKICFLLLIFNFAFLIFNFSNLPPQLPLFYSRPWGEEQLATPEMFLMLPLGALLIVFFNTGLAAFLFEKFPFLARTLIWSTVLISLLLSITVFKVIILVV